jgi:hypothetical protein
VCNFFTLREERRLKTFGDRVLKRTFESKMDEIIGFRQKLRNEELYKFYFLPNIIRMNRSRKWEGQGM